MALLAIDSFDHYATADLAAKGWSPTATVASTVTISAGTGRNSTAALRMVQSGTNNVCSFSKALPSTLTGATCVIGFGFRSVSAFSAASIVTIFDGATIQAQLSLTATGALVFARATSTGTTTTNSISYTTQITTSSLLVVGTYAFIELKVVFANAGGTAEIKVNGVSAGTFSGDTAGTNAAQWSGLLFGRNFVVTETRTFDFDDLYVCDGAGATHNDFLGDHRVIAIVASSGNGTKTDWTPSTGTDHGALVDEATPNTSDYVSTGTVNAIDTFNFAAVGVAGTVKAVQVLHYCKCDVAGLRTMAPAYRIGGADYVGTGALVPADWAYQSAIATVSPATAAAWTVAEIDAAEFGVKVTV